MVGDFYIHVVSNANGFDNKTSSFTQRLSKKLEFNGSWYVGLSNIIYPYSWPNLGTDGRQSIEVTWKTGVVTRLNVAAAAHKSCERLAESLQRLMVQGSLCKPTVEETRKRKRNVEVASHKRQKRDQLAGTTEEQLAEAIRTVTGKSPKEHDEDVKQLRQRITTLKADMKKLDDERTKEINTLRDTITSMQTTETTNKSLTDLGIKQLQDQITQLTAKALEDKLNYDQLIRENTQRLTETRDKLHETEDAATKQRNDVLQTSQFYETRIRLLEARIVELENRTVSPKENDAEDVELITPDGCDVVTGYPYDQLSEHVRFRYDALGERFVLELNTAHIEQVRISEQLKFMLGFEEEVFVAPTTVARYMPDMLGDVHSLYVYAPQLVEPTLIGDTYAPLLRITKVKGTPGEMVEDTFLAPQYHKILEKQTNEISIQIRTATGRLVPFNWGECILVLHFKKASLY